MYLGFFQDSKLHFLVFPGFHLNIPNYMGSINPVLSCYHDSHHEEQLRLPQGYALHPSTINTRRSLGKWRAQGQTWFQHDQNSASKKSCYSTRRRISDTGFSPVCFHGHSALAFLRCSSTHIIFKLWIILRT